MEPYRYFILNHPTILKQDLSVLALLSLTTRASYRCSEDLLNRTGPRLCSKTNAVSVFFIL